MKGIRLKLLGSTMMAVVMLAGGVSAAAGKTIDAGLQSLANYKLREAKLNDSVTARVADGAAVLEGMVPAVGWIERAEREVSTIKGISSVTNLIQVTKSGASDEEILSEARRRIRGYSFYTIFDNVELASRDGHITLSGEVTQPWRRDDLGRLVSFVPGVRRVENSLEVLPVSPMDDEIRIRVARAIYREPGISRYAIQANPPIHIVVKNGNVTLTGVVHNAVEKALVERAARFAATYFALENKLVVETELARSKS